MIAPEHPAHFSGGQHSSHGQITPKGSNLVARTFGSVQRKEEQGNLSGTRGLGDLLETGKGYASPASKSDCVAAALRQQRLDAIDKSRRHRNWLARGTCKQPFCHRPFEHLAARRQPEASARKVGGHIGHKFTARADDKAQQMRAIAHFTGDDATPPRPIRRALLIAPSGCGIFVAARRAYSPLPASVGVS
jgi:hypothetical protein